MRTTIDIINNKTVGKHFWFQAISVYPDGTRNISASYRDLNTILNGFNTILERYKDVKCVRIIAINKNNEVMTVWEQLRD